MELWIRSQDKEKIFKCDGLMIYCTCEEMPSVASYEICDSFEGSVAKYKTKERALEVLDEIESVMKTNCGFELYSRTGIYPNKFNEKWNCVPVYQMPKE